MSDSQTPTVGTSTPEDATDTASRTRGGGVRRFTREVVTELEYVSWPTYAQTVRYTGIVLAFLLIVVALIGGADAALAAATTRIFG